MSKKILKNKNYIYVLVICILSLSVLSITYINNVDNIYKESLSETYNIVKDSKKDIMSQIIDNQIKNISLDKEITFKKTSKLYYELDVLLDELPSENLSEIFSLHIEKSIYKVFDDFLYSDIFIWDKSKHEIINYIGNNNLDKDAINSKATLDRQLQTYKFRIVKEFNNSQVLIIGVTEEFLNDIVKDITKNKLMSMDLYKDNPVVIKEIISYDGGDNYAKTIINTHSMDEKNKLLSTKTKDINGNKIYLTELEGLKNNGSVFYEYYYKDNNIINHRLVYTKLYKEYNWAISTSISADSIDKTFKEHLHSFSKIGTYQINYTIIIAILSFILAGITGMIVFNFNKINQIELDKQNNKIILQHYNLLEKKYDQTKEIVHDIKNHLICIKGLAENLDNKQVVDYVNSINNDIAQLSYLPITNNQLLNIILNEKLFVMQKYKINFKHQIQDLNLDFIENKDLCIIITNLLDNAIESCTKSVLKNIYLKIHFFNNSFVIIKVTNSCDKKPKSKKDGLITSKLDKVYHGYGLYNIKKSILKYDGTIDFKYIDESKEFYIAIIIPILQ